MDREEPHRVGALLFGDGLQLLAADRLLVAHEADEPFDVRPAQLLVRAGQASELANVRVAPAAVPPGEHGEVVVVLRHDAFAKQLERRGSTGLDEPLVALHERPEQPLVARRQPLRRGAP